MRFAILLFVLLALAPGNAQAYIDPGAGGMLIQLILGGVAGAAVVLKLYWSRFKARFSRSTDDVDKQD